MNIFSDKVKFRN